MSWEGKGREGTESACAISILDTLHSGEFPDVIVAGFFAVKTGFDAITFILDLRKCKIDFGGNTRNIETSDI